MNSATASNETPLKSSPWSGCLVSSATVLILLLVVWGYLRYDAHRTMTWLLPDGVRIVQMEDHEPGIAADGYRLRVFFDSPEGIETWKTRVCQHTSQLWRPCPADTRIRDTHILCPESIYQVGGQYNLSYYEDGILAEVFYISPNGECWWYEHW